MFSLYDICVCLCSARKYLDQISSTGLFWETRLRKPGLNRALFITACQKILWYFWFYQITATTAHVKQHIQRKEESEFEDIREIKNKRSLCGWHSVRQTLFFSAYLMSAAQRQDHYNRFRHLHRIKPKQWKQNEFLNQCPRVTLWQAGQELSDSLLIAAVKQQHRAPHKHTSPGHTVWTQCAGMFSTPSSLPMCNLHYMIITFTRPTMCVMTFTCAQNKQHTYLLGAGHFFPRTWSEKAQSL